MIHLQRIFSLIQISLVLLTLNLSAVPAAQVSGTSDTLQAIVSRGPYLQMGTATSIVVRWRTSTATSGRVRYGLSSTNLNLFSDDGKFGTEHEVTLTGLIPETTYYYAVGTTTEVLAGDIGYYFVTAPVIGTTKPATIWVIGDSGTANYDAQAVRMAYEGYIGPQHTNLWLMLGDNAYRDGTDNQYQAAVFNVYPAMLRTSVLWSTRGNHENTDGNGSVYYNIFSFPKAGEAGGLPSGSEAYYSFDYGNIHFICLDSQGSDRSPNGAMLTWLKNDLADTKQDWIIAFWHHPPYSKGSHDSDSEAQLVQMRQNALPILEAAGVDLVLAGHSHSYERSYLIDGHYGTSNTFTQSMKKNAGGGRPDISGAYQKGTLGPAPHEGAVYAVAGSSGKISGGPLNHPAMFVSLNLLGSMVLNVEGNRLDAKFLTDKGIVGDYFTILKGTSQPAISKLSPSSQPAGSAAFALTVEGANFQRSSLVQWNGQTRPTTFVNSNKLVAEISAADVAAAGTANLVVLNPEPLNHKSNAQAFTVATPPLVLETAVLNSGMAGSSITQAMHCTGGVTPYNWAVTAGALPAGLSLSPDTGMLSGTPETAGTYTFTVQVKDKMGATSAATYNLVINNPTPTVSSYRLTRSSSEHSTMTLTIMGTNFVNGSVVQWRGITCATTFVSSTELRAVLPVTLFTRRGRAMINVLNPTPGGGISNKRPYALGPRYGLTRQLRRRLERNP